MSRLVKVTEPRDIYTPLSFLRELGVDQVCRCYCCLLKYLTRQDMYSETRESFRSNRRVHARRRFFSLITLLLYIQLVVIFLLQR